MPVLRTALIALSRSPFLEKAIVRFPVSRRMARRFVAGETLADALDAVRRLNAQGLCASLDHLGENVASRAEATAAADEYLLALDAIRDAGVDSNVSIKLTQMGLDLGDDFCYANVSRILRKAAETGKAGGRPLLVRIDMEGSEYTQRTIDMYRRLCREFDNVGIVIQAYLRRSQADVEALIAEGGGRFRLCKGAYDEPERIAYRERARVTRALDDLARAALSPEARAKGAYAGIASHDQDVVNYVRAYAHQNQVPTDAFEFQMLYGIRRDLQLDLARRGYKVRIYVPYGDHWYPYFMRRLAERPANLAFFLRALIGD